MFTNVLTGAAIMPEMVDRFHAHGFEMNSMSLAEAAVVYGVMDRLDGIFARRAARRGLHPTEKDMKRDPLHDKIYAYMAMGTAALMLASEGIVTKDHSKLGYAAGITANMGAVLYRDIKMTASRNNAVDGVKPAAIGINKWKTGAQNVAHALVMSPLPAWVPIPR